jgi:glucosamine kinase
LAGAPVSAYVGIDGGGTYTRALAFDRSGAQLGEGRSGPSNWQAVGVEAAVRAVRDAALAAAGGADILGVGACLAGVDLPEDVARLAEPLGAALGCEVHVENDIVAAAFAVPGDPAGVVSSGTGAAVALLQGGEVRRLLALNEYTGPGGGAGDIVRQALRAAILGAQGASPATVLSDELPRAFGLEDCVALARATESKDLPGWQVALLVTPICARAALAGDVVAASILEDQGRALGDTSGRFFAAHLQSRDVVIALHGGLLRGGPPAYRSGFSKGILAQLPAGRLTEEGLSALEGAALYAATRFGLEEGLGPKFLRHEDGD